MAVAQSEILEAAIATLRGDGALTTLLGGAGRVFNHATQDTPKAKAYLVVFWQPDILWDTKDSLGFDGSLNHEVVSNHHGDREVLKIADRVRALYGESPLVIASGQIVCFDYQTGSLVVQVLETHRMTFSFNVLVDAVGVGP